MIIGVFEVYSQGGSNCVLFLTEKEAADQNLISPSEGPYNANIELSNDEYSELKKNRYLWA